MHSEVSCPVLELQFGLVHWRWALLGLALQARLEDDGAEDVAMMSAGQARFVAAECFWASSHVENTQELALWLSLCRN